MSAMPPKDWYDSWVRSHCAATAADGSAADALLAIRKIATEIWAADELELLECTRRLIAKGQTPKFANEHGDAVCIELQVLRRERTASEKREHEYIPPSECPLCDGCGWVTVPHPRCVWQGKLVTYRSVDGIDHGHIATVAVSCNACPTGRIAREREMSRENPRPTFDGYTAAIHGHDGPALLAEYRRAQAAKARGNGKPGESLRAMFPGLIARIERSQP